MKKKEFWIFTVFAIIILAFFWDLATLKHAFLSGDHREQQYPWAKFYQEQIRHFCLPWWTPDIHCGFPLLAEGQIGAFYPLNYLFFLLLPVKLAYNGIILFQYWLGAAFFYIFLRRLRLSVFPCFLAALIWLFGSTQGGYFYYNYISQKVVIWLPLTLILIDRLTEKKKWQDAFWLAVVFAVQIFGGYLQVAIYSIFYSAIYFLYRWRTGPRDRHAVALFSAAALLGIFFSLVQLLPTLELSLLSSRAGAEKGLAYVGSMNPFGWITLFYPAWDGFLGSEFYIGLAGLFFVLLVFLSGKSRDEKFFIGTSALFLLLALGKYSPLYRLLVEATGFNGFRTPIKFLFFVSFSFTVLAAFGAEKFFSGGLEKKKIRQTAGVLAALCLFFLALPQAAPAFLKDQKSVLLSKFQNFVVRNYYGHAGHPYPLEYYRQKAAGFYDYGVQSMSLVTPDTRTEFVLLLFLFFTALVLFVRPSAGRFFKIFFALFLITDLYLYGFTSIKANEEPFDTIDGPSKSGLVEYLKRDPGLYRVMEVYRTPQENRQFPVFPNFNMIDRLQDIGVYSPLVMKDYKNFLEGWASINDSLSVPSVDPEKVKAHLNDLSFLNVKYLLSTVPLDHPSLEKAAEEKNVLLYKNRDVISRAFFVPGMDSLRSFDEVERSKIIQVPIQKYGTAGMEIQFNAPADGLLMISDIFYEGWGEIRVDGKADWLRKNAGLFRGVRLQAGNHEIRLHYSTGIFKVLGLTAFCVFIWGCAEGAKA